MFCCSRCTTLSFFSTFLSIYHSSLTFICKLWLTNPCMVAHSIPYHKVVMVLRASITSENVVSLSDVVTPLHSSTNQELFKKYICIKVWKVRVVLCTPVIIWNWSIHFPSLSAMFNLLHSRTNQELFEKHLCNQGSHYEKYEKAIMCKHQINAFYCQQRWMEHKGGHWYVSPWRIQWTYCSMPKGTSQAEAMSNSEKSSEKIKPVILAVIELCLTEGISQAVSQS